MDLDLVALALELEDGPNNATYVPKFYFHHTFEVNNSGTCSREIGPTNTILRRRLARKHGPNSPSPINR